MTLSCEEALRLLPAYGDGELDLANSLAIEAHLAGCSACSTALHAQRELGKLLRTQAPYHAMPASLRKRLSASLPQPAAPAAKAEAVTAARWRRELLRWAMPLAAALVVAVGVNGLLVQRHTDAVLADEIVASHVRSLLAAHLDDVASSDQHTVKPWFAGKLDYSPPVRDLAASGFPLAGGRLDYVDHKTVAALDYRHGPHIINVFVWPSRTSGERPALAITQAGYNLERWRAAGMDWWAVSDMNAEELRAFAELLRGAVAQAPAAAG